MKIKLIYKILIISSLTFQFVNNGDSKNIYNKNIEIKLLHPITRKQILSYIKGKTYFIDAIKGNDVNGNGTSNKPWKTLSKVQFFLKAGDAVILRNGNYGKFDYINKYKNWVLYINEEGATPMFTSISLRNNAANKVHLLNLVFYGIKILPEVVIQTVDPQFAESTLKTYNKTVDPINLYFTGSVRFYNCEISGYNKHLTGGIYLSNSQNIVIERCHIHKVVAPITYINSSNIQMSYNYLHEICSSFFKDGGGCSDIRIEGNHAHDANWNYLEDWCPRASGETYHGSLVAVCSPNTIIRNNILHDGGITSGIMFYSGGSKPFSNMLIENNLIYDSHNSTAVVIALTGKNVLIRNNIIIGRGRYNNTNHYKYNVAMQIYAPFGRYSSSAIFIYNNIFVGLVGFYDLNRTHEGNNIYWATLNGSNLLTQSSFPNSKIVYGNETIDYFNNVFFNCTLNVSWEYWDDVPPDWQTTITLNSPGHQQLLNLSLHNGSDGINFGDPVNQSVDSLGSLDVNDQFILPDGQTREINHHSAGCYEKY